MISLIRVISLLIFSASIYMFSLDGDFVFDDSEAIVKNADVKLDTPVSSVFHNDFWGTNMKSNLSHKSYRPLTVISFRINRHLSGEKLKPFHFKITNLILHTFVCVTIYLLLSNILKNSGKSKSTEIWKDIPFLSSILFSAHPIHVEAVSGIVGRADILAALFFFLCILFYDKSADRSKANTVAICDEHSFKNVFLRWLHFALALLCAGIALLCKETGVTALVICSIYDTFIIHKISLMKVFQNITLIIVIKSKTSHNDKSETIWQIVKNYKEFIIRQIVLYIFLLILLYTRMMIMDFKGPVFQITDNPAAFSDSFITRVATYNYLYFLNLLILIWPQWLCFDWSMGCIPILKSFLDPRIVFIGLFWSFICGIAYRLLSHRNEKYRELYTISFSILALPFLPASNLVMPVGFVVAERILYTSSLGFCMLVVIGFQNLMDYSRHRGWQKLLKSSFILLIIVMSVRSLDRSFQWRSERRLFKSAVAVCPYNAKVHYNIGKEAGDRSDVNTAEQAYRLAIRLHPGYYQAMNNLANLLKDQSRFEEAKNLLTEALIIKEDFPAAWMNLGIVLANLKQPAASEKAYMQALRYRRKYADCLYNLGNLYLEENKYELALTSWSKATSINPHHVVAWSNTLALLDNSGQIDRGLLLAPSALQALPNAASVHFNVANLFGKKGQFLEAEEHFLRAIQLKGRNVQAVYYANLGVLYHRWKKSDKAIEMYKKALEIDPRLNSAKDNLRKLEKLK